MSPPDPHDLHLDRQLVARMAAGDADALAELHDRHVARLLGLALRIVGDREEAREAVQDTMIKAWRQASRYRSERGEVFAWLTFMVRSTAIDRLRRQRRQPPRVELDLAAAAPRMEAGADRREWLEHQLSHLSSDQRQALELAFFSGCTQMEIAERMATPVGNVKNHLRRGLLKLRQLVLP